MARVLSTSRLFKSLSSDSIIPFLAKRGFATVAEAGRRSPKTEEMETATKLLAGKRVAAGVDPDPWIPDPVTGYYRPANQAVQVDAAELRAMMLRPKT